MNKTVSFTPMNTPVVESSSNFDQIVIQNVTETESVLSRLDSLIKSIEKLIVELKRNELKSNDKKNCITSY